MGHLSADITRLAEDIHAGHGERHRLIQGLRQARAELTRGVGRMQLGFRTAHAEMARRQRRGLHEFLLGLERRVAALRYAFRTDLAGARAAWNGAPAGIGQDARLPDSPSRPASTARAGTERSAHTAAPKRRRPPA